MTRTPRPFARLGLALALFPLTAGCVSGNLVAHDAERAVAVPPRVVLLDAAASPFTNDGRSEWRYGTGHDGLQLRYHVKNDGGQDAMGWWRVALVPDDCGACWYHPGDWLTIPAGGTRTFAATFYPPHDGTYAFQLLWNATWTTRTPEAPLGGLLHARFPCTNDACA